MLNKYIESGDILNKRNKPKVVLELFSDGASFNNGYKNDKLPQRCSCGVVICIDKKIIRSGGKDLGDNTISYAELYGALLVIKSAIRTVNNFPQYDFDINLYSDSNYVVNSMNKWLDGWIKKGWVNSSGVEVLYQELWTELRDYKKKYDIKFHHIKGHLPKKQLERLSEDKKFYHLMNEECDKLAKQKIEEYKDALNL